jgi:DNA-binding response OmpR family regulator/signal transduction histidine kinase
LVSDGRYSLLFVDDEAEVLDILSRTFADDYDVLTASSGAEALEILGRQEVDLLVSDQRMPRMTGVQLIEKARERHPDLTCIILTAYTDPPDLIAAINRGQVYRYVTKPWDLHELVLTVEQALEKVRLRRENAQLLAEARQRLAALEVLYEVSRGATSITTYGEVVDRVTALLERVVALDVSATLVRVDPDRPATLTLRCRGAVDEAALLQLKEMVLERHRALTGERLLDDDVLVRITGRRTAPVDGDDAGGPWARAVRRIRSRVFIPLHASGRPTGLLAVAADRDEAFGAEDERILDILANQTAEIIAALKGKLDAEKQRMHRMVEGMADGLVMTDATGEVVVANAAARRLLQVPENQAVTSRFLQDALGFYPFELVRGWERRGARPLAEDLEVDGRVLHSVVSPVTGGDGALGGVVVALRDVTEERRLQQRKQEFVSVISHELRTPLTAITGSLDLVLGGLAGEVPEKQERYLALAKSSVDRLNSIVDDLLDLEKLAQGKMHLDLEVACLDEVVSAAVERYEGAFQKRKLTVEIKRPPESVPVLVDAGRIHQVLGNLLTNAVKFTPEGGRIEVEIFREVQVAGTAGFSVWNNGDPIPAGDLERIFERFEQADSQAGRRIRGTGLGLPICRSIVEGHGGRVWAESGRESGARFVVVLPLDGVDEAQVVAAAGPEIEAEAPVFVDRGEGQRVLVVDDDRATAYAIKGVLLSGGFSVEVAHRADEGLALARRHRPSVAVVDIFLPEIDGSRLIEILRHDPDTRGVPVLAVSSPGESSRARRAGAHAFLAKPIDAARLLSSVRSLAGGQREGKRILVVDDDPAIRGLCADALAGLGYDVAVADGVGDCRAKIDSYRPDLVLLDLMLPDGDGFALLESLKADRATGFVSVILISARSETKDKVRALRMGGDDYLTKPFDAMELAARVESVLRRRDLELAASPTTRLPGGMAVERAVSRRIEEGRPFSLCYLDLDNLKAFNDYYGYAKADGVILQTGDLLREVVASYGGPDDFLGHIAGDDFVFITTPDRVDALCRSTIETFERIIPLYYNREDRDRGYIETEDRYGAMRQFPIMTLSVVAVTDFGGRFETHAEMAQVAASLKKRAKAVEGSTYLRDDGTSRALA